MVRPHIGISGGGGSVSTARQWIASLGEEVSPMRLDGAPAWMLSAHVRDVRELPPIRSVRLLPGFDQYVVAASCHAEHLLPCHLRGRVYRPQGWISPVLLVNGACRVSGLNGLRAAASKFSCHRAVRQGTRVRASRGWSGGRSPGRVSRRRLELVLEELTGRSSCRPSSDDPIRLSRHSPARGDTSSGSWDRSDESHLNEWRSKYGSHFAWFRLDGRDYIHSDKAW